MSSAHPGQPHSPRSGPSRAGLRSTRGASDSLNVGLGQLVAAASFASEGTPQHTHNSPLQPFNPAMAHNAGAGTSSARLAGPESGSSVVAALQARQPKAGAKRGRKRIQDKTHDQGKPRSFVWIGRGPKSATSWWSSTMMGSPSQPINNQPITDAHQSYLRLGRGDLTLTG